MKIYKIHFRNSKNVYPVKNNAFILQALQENNVETNIPSYCGGIAKCGKCKIKIIKGRVSHSTDIEKKFLSSAELTDGIRLACQTKALGDIMLGEMKAEELKLNYQITKSPNHQITNKSSIFNPCLKHTGTSLQSSICRTYGVAFDIGTNTLVGYLIDLNTGEEKAKYAKLNKQMKFGADIATRISYVNSQFLISNFHSQTSNSQHKGTKTLKQLHNALLETMQDIISNLTKMSGIPANEIYEVTAAGNTCMLHLLLGIDPTSLAVAPFTPTFLEAQNINSKSLKLETNKHAHVYLLPCIGSYVGADTIAAILATGLHKRKKMTLLIDVGTNAEIVLGNKDKIITCAAAAGPSFEGINISCGCHAMEGAIERVWFEKEDGKAQRHKGKVAVALLCDDRHRRIEDCRFGDLVIEKGTKAQAGKGVKLEYKVIGNCAPLGICGSGLVDTVAELLKNGLLDSSGKFQFTDAKFCVSVPPPTNNNCFSSALQRFSIIAERMCKWNDNLVFMIEENTNPPIFVSQNDIRALQLAKTAIFTGIKVLEKHLGIEDKNIDEVLIAGAFGSYLDKKNAVAIGLIPNFTLKKIKIVGNAAGGGAKMLLISKDKRKIAENLSKNIEYIELSASRYFSNLFLENLNFPEDSNLFQDRV